MVIMKWQEFLLLGRENNGIKAVGFKRSDFNKLRKLQNGKITSSSTQEGIIQKNGNYVK